MLYLLPLKLGFLIISKGVQIFECTYFKPAENSLPFLSVEYIKDGYFSLLVTKVVLVSKYIVVLKCCLVGFF